MRRRESLTQDMTPLVDVVFLLLIFFLVTSVFKKEELALLLNLPHGKEGERMVEKRDIVIELSKEALALNHETLDFATLDEKLALIEQKDRPVIVRIDEHVEYGRIIKLFNLLKKHRLGNLALVEQKER
ncbi:ExbD/TolR family protein [Hydrogenimonas sp.]